MTLKAGDRLTISAEWLGACGKLNMLGAVWLVQRVQYTPGGDALYHVTHKQQSWVVASWRGVTLVHTTPQKRARKQARKHARVYAQRPFVRETEDRKAYMRALEASSANLHILLAYRDCWQYGRYVHGAVSGTRQAFIVACWEELQYCKRVRA